MKAFFVLCMAVFLPLIVTSHEKCKNQHFLEFKYMYNKTYESADEELRRCEIFTQNLNEIEDNNRKLKFNGEDSYIEAVNKFSDLTTEEFVRKHTGLPPPPLNGAVNSSDVNRRPEFLLEKLPADWAPQSNELDLRINQIPVKNQLACGCCWAFSATGVFEYYLYKRYRTYYDLSEQMSLDCVRRDGCNGGWMHETFEYFQQKGADFDQIYPYTAVNGRCRYVDTRTRGAGIENKFAKQWYVAEPDEKKLMYLLETVGWVSISINANDIMSYSSGVFPASRCSYGPNHAVILIGYGTNERGVPYWLVKNSWGADWGEEGYFKLERGKNTCDLMNPYPYYRVYIQ